MTQQNPRKPQDRKPKALKAGQFEVDGKRYTLPSPGQALPTLPGRALRDALLDGQEGELRLAFMAIEAAGTDEATLDALYSLPVPDMMAVVGPWMQSADMGGGVSLPESPSSSD